MDLELGNLIFNNKNQEYQCPEFIIALLRDLDRRLSIIQYNIYQKPYESPFDNTGNSFIELSDLFEIHAYNWDENNSQDYNFIFKTGSKSNLGDIKISWYKYLGRDTTINVDIKGSESIILDLYQDCLKALNEYESKNFNSEKIKNSKSEQDLNEKSEWEIGNCNDEDIIFLNLKGNEDRKFSRFHLNIKDVSKLINDLNLTIMRSYYEKQSFKIIRKRKE